MELVEICIVLIKLDCCLENKEVEYNPRNRNEYNQDRKKCSGQIWGSIYRCCFNGRRGLPFLYQDGDGKDCRRHTCWLPWTHRSPMHCKIKSLRQAPHYFLPPSPPQIRTFPPLILFTLSFGLTFIWSSYFQFCIPLRYRFSGYYFLHYAVLTEKKKLMGMRSKENDSLGRSKP